MSGKKGSRWGQTTRLSSPTNLEELRRLIDAKTIAQALKDHALGRTKMNASQVTAALGLLRKAMPDLAAMEVSGDASKPLIVTVDEILSRIPAAWLAASGDAPAAADALPVTH